MDSKLGMSIFFKVAWISYLNPLTNRAAIGSRHTWPPGQSQGT